MHDIVPILIAVGGGGLAMFVWLNAVTSGFTNPKGLPGASASTTTGAATG